jgi:hypothetical protein
MPTLKRSAKSVLHNHGRFAVSLAPDAVSEILRRFFIAVALPLVVSGVSDAPAPDHQYSARGSWSLDRFAR